MANAGNWHKLAGTAVKADELLITGLGAQGDGVAGSDAGRRYVPFALPGERVQPVAEGPPRLLSAPSPDRTTPLCRHFGTCGGCAAQHMSERLYADWKRDIVVAAFCQRGLAPDIAPLRRLSPGTRRRAVLTARRVGQRIAIGYHRRKSLDVIDIEECPVLHQDIVAKFPALRAIAAALSIPEARLTVLSTRAGLDVAVDTPGGRRGPAAVAKIGGIAEEHRLARVAVGGETMIERARPILSPAAIDIGVPPGVFAQAVQEAEDAMAQLVLAGVGGAQSVADLFCGIGTFTFHLARRARVLALDSDDTAVAALVGATRRVQGLKPIEAKARDLFRDPLSAKELERFEAVVLDPPRAGARGQAEQLARSNVRTVAAVACDPGTLARDVRLLVDGGYAIDSVTPIDQFLFSAHVEVVVILKRTPSFR